MLRPPMVSVRDVGEQLVFVYVGRPQSRRTLLTLRTMQDGSHVSDMEEVVHLPLATWEELLVPRVLASLADLVVGINCKCNV